MPSRRARRVAVVNLHRCSSLLRTRNFGLLWLAGLISITGDWVLRVALPVYVLRLTGSASALAVVVMAGLVAGLIAGPAAGVFIDRWDRRRVLVCVNAAQAAGVLPLLAVGSASQAWIAVAVAFGESALAQVASPAESALLPGLVGPDQLASANSMLSVANFVARLTGPAVGGAVTATARLDGAAGIDAATFATAAIACALITGTHRPGRAGHPGLRERGWPRGPGRWRRLRLEFADGVAAIAASRMATAVLVFVTVISVGEGMMSSLFAVWVIRAMHMDGRQMGWMLSAQAMGGIAGSLTGTLAVRRFRPVSLSSVCMALFGLGDLAIFNAPRWDSALWPLITLFFAIGIVAGAGYPPLITLFQLAAPDRMRGRMFAVLAGAQAAASIAGAAAAGALGGRVSPVSLLTAQGAGYVVAAATLRAVAGRGPYRLGEPAIKVRTRARPRSPSS
jgi:MFS family permease